ncbi:MAG: M20/M25/M40 family metallo-hydrolase [Calditrichia bacterium]
MHRRIYTIFMIFTSLIGFILAGQPEQYLIRVTLSDNTNRQSFETLQVPMYLQIDEQELICSGNDEIISHLRQKGIDYKILDDSPWSEKYFVISQRLNNKLILNDKFGEVIWSSGRIALVKTAGLPLSELIGKGYQIAELPRYPKKYVNQKIYWKDNPEISFYSDISDVLAEVSPDTVQYFIQSLQGFGTRFLLAPTRDSVATWIKEQFLAMGITDVVIDSFQYSGTWQKNVVATLPGTVTPDQVYVFGGHHDSYSYGNPMQVAPGADDNASGTAATLEVARAMMATGYQPDATIKFVTFAAEEYGLYGSADFAQKAVASGLNIQLMINHDMISYTNGTPGNWRVGMNYYSGSEHIMNIASTLMQQYTTLVPMQGTLNASFSDSYSFWTAGFHSFYFEEYDFSPYYHSANDIISNYNMNFCAEVIKASAALLIFTSATPAMVNDVQLVDYGTGSSLRLSWTLSPDPDIDHYNVYVGTASGIYDTTFAVTDSPYLIENLTEGVEYFVGISAVDNAGNEGVIVERSATPYAIPREYDLMGYNIFRSEQPGGVAITLNQNVVQDTFYVDQTAQDGIYYYYSVSAVDSSSNESLKSDEVRSRVVSLNDGILIVDETADGSGAIFQPTDAEVDSFYAAVLENFSFSQYDILQEGDIKLADIGAYSTVVWHGDDFSDLGLPATRQEMFKNYLDFGGNLLITSFLPSESFAGNTSYPASFSPGEFIYDYLKISNVNFSPAARFIGAYPAVTGYDSIYVDTSKTSATLNYHLPKIETITPNAQASVIYRYDSDYASNTPMGILNGEPVGLEYLGSDYNLVVLSFPLYYMQLEPSRDFIDLVLEQKFNEVTAIPNPVSEVPSAYQLGQNYPNPFNPTTTISYNLKENSKVEITIFSLLGQKIRTLADGWESAGFRTVRWDGRDDSGSLVASGVYIYRLKADRFIATRKMILLR